MMITILSQIYHNTKLNSMILITVTLVLFTAMLMSATLGYSYNVANAQSSSKKSSTNCENDVCHTLTCIDKNCQTSVSNPTQLKSHGLLSNSIQQWLNSPNP